jgi:hypothetical protein
MKNTEMGPCIEILPVELLTNILEIVRGSSRNDFVTCLRVCQQWNVIGSPVLWKHIYLRIQSAKHFSAQVLHLSDKVDGRSTLNSVRSLRVMVPGDGRDYSGSGSKHTPTEILTYGIDAIAVALPHLENLCTFSAMAYGGTRMNGEDDFLGSVPAATRSPGPNQNVFTTILKALPNSVRDLSLDLSELSRVEPTQKCDICPAINHIARRLHHLNLHLRTYCPTLLDLRWPNGDFQSNEFRSVIVRMHGFRVKQCTYPVRPQPVRWLPFNVQSFTHRMKQLYDSGECPSLKQLLIISKRRPSYLVQHEDCKWSVYAREIVSNKTAAFPRVFLEQHKAPPPGNSYTYAPRATIRVPDQCPFVHPAYWGQEYVSGCGAIRRLVEGTAGWTIFSHGPHLPGMRVNEIRAAANEGYCLKTPGPEEAATFRSQCDVACSLWSEEDECGQKLLQATVWDGVLDDHLLQRREIGDVVMMN